MRLKLEELSLDSSGRVQLDDVLLRDLAEAALHFSGGQSQSNQTSCTNSASCHNSTNGTCTNAAGQCDSATNRTRCMIVRGP